MSRDPDDDALRWEGDDDPTLAPGWKAAGKPVEHGGAGEGTAATADEAETPAESAASSQADTQADAVPQTGSVELVALGVLGGVYLLYSIGWLVIATTPAPFLADPVAQFMYGLGRWFAVSAAALWFATVLWLTAGRRRARIAWLVAGAVLLIPLPFLLRG